MEEKISLEEKLASQQRLIISHNLNQNLVLVSLDNGEELSLDRSNYLFNSYANILTCGADEIRLGEYEFKKDEDTATVEALHDMASRFLIYKKIGKLPRTHLINF